MNNSESISTTTHPSKVSIYEERLSGWRKAKDTLANVTITAGGMAVLLAILLIFFYLLYEIMPLFKSATLEPVTTFTLRQPSSSKPLYLAMEEQAEIAVQLDDSGLMQFFRAESGAPVTQVQLPVSAPISQFALNSEQYPLMAIAAANQVILVKPDYKITYPEDKRLISPVVKFPYDELLISFGGGDISALAVRDNDQQLVLVAQVNGRLEGRRYVKEEDFLSGDVVLQEQSLNLPSVEMDIDWMLIGPDQRWLYLVSKAGDYRVINLLDEKLVDSGRLLETGQISDVRFLLGGISLLVSTSQGEIVQWFMARKNGKSSRMQQVRSFQQGPGAISQVAVEHRRKGFVTVDENNTLGIYYTTSARQLLAETIEESAAQVKQLAIAPRANALLTLNSSGQYRFWRLHNEHPEVSWSALWNKVWYESYPEPDYVWQSSAANNDFEAKYSFTPLAFGTLKAAFYAMLIATPLALCGAIYTAYFMAPAVRRKVKPLIELMEALPTVILGFLAGLWLAPFVENNLPGIFSIFILLPVGVLLFGYLWSRLPASIRLSVPYGWHPILLIPIVILICWGCVAASGSLEVWFFSGDMRSWLTHDLGISFDQRNAMVVGIAMGFAVVPNIFSIAEDAIFSVPKSLSYGSLALGATPWQTLVGVVIPTASPGIFSALMIGMGRAVGETMIVLMATGNTPVMDVNIFEGMRTLAANIAVEIGETEVDSSHYRVLFLAAFVLFMFTFVVNTAAEIVRQRLRKKYGSL
jgi:phosphate transport system permease protein